MSFNPTTDSSTGITPSGIEAIVVNPPATAEETNAPIIDAVTDLGAIHDALDNLARETGLTRNSLAFGGFATFTYNEDGSLTLHLPGELLSSPHLFSDASPSDGTVVTRPTPVRDREAAPSSPLSTTIAAPMATIAMSATHGGNESGDTLPTLHPRSGQ